MRCEVHDLAGGPDGRCALCHSLDQQRARREGARLGWILFLGLGTACGGLLAIHTLKARPPDAASLSRSATSREPDRLASEAVTPVAPAATPLPAAAPSVVPPAAPSDASVAPATVNEATAAAAPARPAPTPAELHAAVVATPISMYTAPWCGTCRRAHAFLQANGLTCKDIDVDENPAALRELKARSGGTSIPVIDVDGKLLRAGFSERAVERALAESVERRLGLTGVELRSSL
jgi:glutaredoxin